MFLPLFQILRRSNLVERASPCSKQARRKRGGWGGFSPPNNLLKFVDFETEKGCKSQGRRNKYSNSYIFEEALRIYQNAISFDVIEVKDFKIFRERLSLVVIFSSVISKNGAFSSDLKGVVMKNFSGGKPPDPHFFSLRSHLVSAPPPNMKFVATGLVKQHF